MQWLVSSPKKNLRFCLKFFFIWNLCACFTGASIYESQPLTHSKRLALRRRRSTKKHRPRCSSSFVIENSAFSARSGVRTLDTLIKSQVLNSLFFLYFTAFLWFREMKNEILYFYGDTICFMIYGNTVLISCARQNRRIAFLRIIYYNIFHF